MLQSTKTFSVTGNLIAFRLLFLIREKSICVGPGQQCPVNGINLLTRVARFYKKILSFGCLLDALQRSRAVLS